MPNWYYQPNIDMDGSCSLGTRSSFPRPIDPYIFACYCNLLASDDPPVHRGQEHTLQVTAVEKETLCVFVA
jgi:hypothetical protein